MSLPVLSLRGVSKSFSGVRALQDVSIDVWPSQVLAILGPNGSGKSTLIEVAARSLDVDSGQIDMRGRSILRRRPEQLAAFGLARVFQTPMPIDDLRVSDRLALSCYARSSLRSKIMPRGVRARALALLDECGDWIAPLGLHARLDAKMRELSYAEQRYLELASAAYIGRKVLLLDEPTAGLSAQERQPVIALLHQLRAAGVAIMLVEHDLNFVASVADHACVMEQGRVRKSGVAAEVLESRELAEIYLGSAMADA